MNFGEAIKEARDGAKVRRAGWNGKGMWVCYVPPETIPEGLVDGRTKMLIPPGEIYVAGFFMLWTAKGTLQPGWFASQEDMLSDDWEVVK